MSNNKTIKYNKISGRRIQNNVDVIFANDDAVITYLAVQKLKYGKWY